MGYIHVNGAGEETVLPYEPPPPGYLIHIITLSESFGGNTVITVALPNGTSPPAPASSREGQGSKIDYFYRLSDFPDGSLVLQENRWQTLKQEDFG